LPAAPDEVRPDAPRELEPSERELTQGSLDLELLGRLSRSPTTAPRARVSADVDPAIEPAWRNCGSAGTRAVQCAELQVPLDIAPAARALVTLQRFRLSTDVRHGELHYNPCAATGATPRDLAASGTFDTLAPGVDIVTFDPHGAGADTTLECELIDAFLTSPAEIRGTLASLDATE
jgi:hypothetical protein